MKLSGKTPAAASVIELCLQWNTFPKQKSSSTDPHGGVFLHSCKCVFQGGTPRVCWSPTSTNTKLLSTESESQTNTLSLPQHPTTALSKSGTVRRWRAKPQPRGECEQPWLQLRTTTGLFLYLQHLWMGSLWWLTWMTAVQSCSVLTHLVFSVRLRTAKPLTDCPSLCLQLCCVCSLLLQVSVDLFSYRRSCEDADLLSGLTLLSRGLGQRIHPAAGSWSK